MIRRISLWPTLTRRSGECGDLIGEAANGGALQGGELYLGEEERSSVEAITHLVVMVRVREGKNENK